MTYPLYEFGGSGPVLLLAVANGFPPAVYAPLLAPLTDRYRVVCLPPRALWWPPQAPPETLRDWRMLAEDLLEGLTRHHLTDVIAVGHSFGGVAALLAALAEPARFRALCLLDPTILPLPAMQVIAQIQTAGGLHEFPLVQGALRRRRAFESVEAAHAYFKTRTLFAGWPDAALRQYAEHGTRPTASGGVELVWPPEWEAYYFGSVYAGIWDDLPRLRDRLPLLVLRGEHSDVFLSEAADQLRGLLPEAAYHEIAGHGHLFPLSAPDATRQALTGWLAAR